MKSKLYTFLSLLLVVFLAGCEYDNHEPPKSYITGRVVYNNEPLGVRSNGVRLELWQPGYALFQKMDIFVAQDGTFSANIFDGTYKITRLRGNGPWADQTDTITVQVKGNAVVDVPVSPFFIIKNPALQKNGNAISATFNLERVNTTRNLERVNLYLSTTTIVDQNNNVANISKTAAQVNLSQPISLSANIPAGLAGRGYVYARLGAKAVGVQELIYSAPIKIMLN